MNRIERAALTIENSNHMLLLATTANGSLDLITSDDGLTSEEAVREKFAKFCGAELTEKLTHLGRYDEYTVDGIVSNHVFLGKFDLSVGLLPRLGEAAFYMPHRIRLADVTPVAREVIRTLANR